MGTGCFPKDVMGGRTSIEGVDYPLYCSRRRGMSIEVLDRTAAIKRARVQWETLDGRRRELAGRMGEIEDAEGPMIV
jgi:hypothetical protein